MRRFSKLMIGYGLFLAACGVVGYAASGFDPKAKTAIFSGAGSGAIMVLLGWLSSHVNPKVRAIAAHAGFVLALLLGATFAWRGVIAWGKVLDGQNVLYLAVLLSFMAVVSFAAFAVLLALRPQPKPAG